MRSQPRTPWEVFWDSVKSIFSPGVQIEALDSKRKNDPLSREERRIYEEEKQINRDA